MVANHSIILIHKMETVEIHACGYNACPYIKMTGKDIAKLTLIVSAILVAGYILYKIA